MYVLPPPTISYTILNMVFGMIGLVHLFMGFSFRRWLLGKRSHAFLFGQATFLRVSPGQNSGPGGKTGLPI